MIKPEVLAPAGSMESLIAALRCGADAVYIGGKQFSARANAENFSLPEIKEAADICHIYGAKLHVAVNTICKNSELSALEKYISKVYEAGVDAFIVQDFGAAEMMKQIAPDAEIHASTQMTIHTVKGAEEAINLGFDRIVLARELSRDEIAEICKLPVDVECFVHGALCMCVSGQCYMSAMIGGRSANRGCCAQSCRLPFTAKGREYYALSLKDLSLANYVKDMIAIGVKSFKIEGRMKRPEYVAAATAAIKEAVAGEKPDMKLLESVFSRSGFTDGYYTGKRKNMFGIRTKENVESADDVFGKIHETYRRPGKRYIVDFNIKIKKDVPFKAYARDNIGDTAEVTAEVPQIAKKRATDSEEIKKQFSKLGETVYTIGKIKTDVEQGLFIPASILNNSRRKLTQLLNLKKIERIGERKSGDFNINISKSQKITKRLIRIEVRTLEQLEAAAEYSYAISAISCPPELCEDAAKKFGRERVIISVPRFLTDEKNIISKLENLRKNNFERLLVTNIAYIKIADDLNFKKEGNWNLNITNDYAIAKYKNLGFSSLIISPELTYMEINALNSGVPYGIYAYGYLPLMITRNCPIENQIGYCGGGLHYLTDRTRRRMPVYCDDKNNITEIFNPDFIWTSGRQDRFRNADFLLLAFTLEDKKATEKIIFDYISKSERAPHGATNGLYLRGVK